MSLLLLALLASPDTLFFEGFDGELAERWILYGDPLPLLVDSAGQPPPCFDNNGDRMWESGAVTRERFDWTGGLVVEADMYVESNERGGWLQGMLGLSTGVPGDNNTVYGCLAHLSYAYNGEAAWRQPHTQGRLSMVNSPYAAATVPPGLREVVMWVHLNDYLDSWHRFRMEVLPEGTVRYMVDDSLYHESETALPAEHPELAVLLGVRSSDYGSVYHDNVLVIRPGDGRR